MFVIVIDGLHIIYIYSMGSSEDTGWVVGSLYYRVEFILLYHQYAHANLLLYNCAKSIYAYFQIFFNIYTSISKLIIRRYSLR